MIVARTVFLIYPGWGLLRTKGHFFIKNAVNALRSVSHRVILLDYHLTPLMLAVFTYDNGAIIVAPPLAKDLSGWHSTNRSVSESEGTCGSFAAVAIEPPRATLSQTWGAHSLSFNFSGMFCAL